MNRPHTTSAFLICTALLGGARDKKDTGPSTMFLGSCQSGGITYYPAHPGITNYGAVDFTTNKPTAGAKDYVVVVTTKCGWEVNIVDAK